VTDNGVSSNLPHHNISVKVMTEGYLTVTDNGVSSNLLHHNISVKVMT
jgi:hypothetical protein